MLSGISLSTGKIKVDNLIVTIKFMNKIVLCRSRSLRNFYAKILNLPILQVSIMTNLKIQTNIRLTVNSTQLVNHKHG